jgi:hypothetical protein
MTTGAQYWRQIVVIADAAQANGQGSPPRPSLPLPSPSRASLPLQSLPLPSPPRPSASSPSALCAACAAAFDVAGVAITLMDPAAAAGGYASDIGTQRLEESQFDLGEGPTVDAFAAGLPVDEVDLTGAQPGRWMAFGPLAAAAGIRSVFSFPLQVGAARVGTLTIYRAKSGGVSDELYRGMLVVADMITRLLLAWQSQAPDGLLALELGQEDVYLAVVHQASGMISVQLDVGVGEALARLRAHAFANSRTVFDVASDVVARRTRFEN